MHQPASRKALFWLLYAAYAAFFGEVLPGSTPYPFTTVAGWLITVPFYGLHGLLVAALLVRHRRVSWPGLVFAGALFALYEAYGTKMFWRPAGEAVWAVHGLAVLTMLVLFAWHTWFSLLTPLVIVEAFLGNRRAIWPGLPGAVRRFYAHPGGWGALTVFAALFWGLYTPSAAAVVRSALATVPVLAGLTWWWNRTARPAPPALAELLPGPRALPWLAAWLLGLYGLLAWGLEPQRIPPVWPAQVMVWALYALFGGLFAWAWKAAPRTPANALPTDTRQPTARTLLGAGLALSLLAPMVHRALAPWRSTVVAALWLGLALLAVGTWISALAALRRGQFPRR